MRARGEQPRGDRRASGDALLEVGELHAEDPEVRPGEAQRFGLPQRRAVIRPRQRGQLGIATQYEVGQGAPGEVRRREPVADVPAREPDAGLRVVARGGVPVARDAERTAPAVGDARIADRREEVAQRAVQVIEHLVDPLERRIHGAAPVVPGASAAEREAVVGRALPVDEQVAVVAEGLAVLDADLVPDRVGQRLGRDHERVERQDAAAHPRPLGAVALERDDHVPRGHGALEARVDAAEPHAARRPVDHLGALEEGDAERLDHLGEAAHELRGVQPRAGGVEHRTRVVAVETRRAEPGADGALVPVLGAVDAEPPQLGDVRLREARAARRCGRTPPSRRARSRSRCPRVGRPDRPRRPCRPSHAASRPPRRSRAGVRAIRRSAGTAPSTSRRCGPTRRSPAISRSSTAMRSAGVGLRAASTPSTARSARRRRCRRRTARPP